MNYEIHIKDTQNIEDPLILHFAERNSISLNWLGSDDKTQAIVGSELNFTLEVLDGEDGKYDSYFTSDEKRFQVTKVISDTQEIVWRGFLLPESYSEPYEYPLFYVGFSAVDGLGLLKGKKLPADFYSEEKKVTDVIAACLSLTGIDFDIYLSPAIVNKIKNKWHEILIDTEKYYDEKKPPSAYDFLDELVFSMRCQLFQADGRWYVEGINKRQLINLTYSKYAIDGTYLGEVEHQKNIKVLSWAPDPGITMVAPYREVIVTHEASQLEFPEGVVQENKVAFDAMPNASVNYYLSKYWDGHNDYYPRVPVETNTLQLANLSQYNGFDASRKVSLRHKPYILRGWRIEITIGIELYFADEVASPSDDLIESWINYAVFKISIAGKEKYNNYQASELDRERLVFDSSGKAELELVFTAQDSGFLEVEFFEPFADQQETGVSAYKVTTLEVSNVNQTEDDVYTLSVDETASQVSEIELPIGQDISGLSKSFYFDYQKALSNTDYPTLPIEIYSIFEQDDFCYYVVDIYGATMAANYPGNLIARPYGTGTLINDFEVIYNFNGSEEHVIKAAQVYDIDQFFVRRKGFQTSTVDREQWLLWSDAIYGIEEKPYNQVVAEIEKKLFEVQHLRIEAQAHNPVKFNDVIRFKWKGEYKYFVPTSCEWMPDDNVSSLVMVEGMYAGNSVGYLPPYVDAGEDVLIASDANVATASGAVAFDPDGDLQSILWEKVGGDSGGDVINNATGLGPVFQNLTGNHYVYRVTATDIQGNTSFDEMEVNRVNPLSLSLDLIDSLTDVTGDHHLKLDTYKLNIFPQMTLGYSVNLHCRMIFSYATPSYEGSKHYCVITKNGQMYRWDLERQPIDIDDSIDYEKEKVYEGIISYRYGDDIEIMLFSELIHPNTGGMWSSSRSGFEIGEYLVTNGYPVVNGVPTNLIEVVNEP